MLPLLEVLDGYDKDNKEVYSDIEDDGEDEKQVNRKRGNLKG